MNLLINRAKIFVALFCALAVTACNNYGKKVTFTGNKGEVYYKGDGVTEADAKAVGKFLEDQQYFLKDDKSRSVQITKENDRIKLRFVVDEKALAAISGADATFSLLGALISKTIFNNTPVDVIYTDNVFKDMKTLPYAGDAAKAASAYEEMKLMEKKEYNKNTLYYKNISSEEADNISGYLIKNGFFSDEGGKDLMVAKTGDSSYHVRFFIQNSFANEDGLQKADDFGKVLKKDLFTNSILQFEVLDQNMTPLKTFIY
jgi:hypothetical protein